MTKVHHWKPVRRIGRLEGEVEVEVEGGRIVLEGSCLCGAIGYEILRPPQLAYNCHCQRCRKVRGTAFAANLFVPLDALRYTRGEDKLESYKVPEAERFTHVFCSVCGSSLPFLNVARGLAVVPMGSLDDDPGHSPDAHIFVGSKAPWFTITDSLPQHQSQFAKPSKPTE